MDAVVMIAVVMATTTPPATIMSLTSTASRNPRSVREPVAARIELTTALLTTKNVPAASTAGPTRSGSEAP